MDKTYAKQWYLAERCHGTDAPLSSCFAVGPDTGGRTPTRTLPKEWAASGQYDPECPLHSQHSGAHWNHNNICINNTHLFFTMGKVAPTENFRGEKGQFRCAHFTKTWITITHFLCITNKYFDKYNELFYNWQWRVLLWYFKEAI